MKDLDDVFRVLYQWENGGTRILPNGTKQICHVPLVAPQAWLHKIYWPLDQEIVLQLEQKIDAKLPNDYVSLLRVTNGLNIFSDSLSLWGIRDSYVRTGPEAVQPYSLVDMNLERPRKCPKTWVFFGGYSWDGSRVFFDTAEGANSSRVSYVKRDSIAVLKQWPTFMDWLQEEVQRLSSLFDENGYKIDKSVPTCPAVP